MPDLIRFLFIKGKLKKSLVYIWFSCVCFFFFFFLLDYRLKYICGGWHGSRVTVFHFNYSELIFYWYFLKTERILFEFVIQSCMHSFSSHWLYWTIQMSDHLQNLFFMHPPLSVSCRKSFIMVTVPTWPRTSWWRFIFAGGVCRDVWRTSFIRWSISTEDFNVAPAQKGTTFSLVLYWLTFNNSSSESEKCFHHISL